MVIIYFIKLNLLSVLSCGVANWCTTSLLKEIVMQATFVSLKYLSTSPPLYSDSLVQQEQERPFETILRKMYSSAEIILRKMLDKCCGLIRRQLEE